MRPPKKQTIPSDDDVADIDNNELESTEVIDVAATPDDKTGTGKKSGLSFSPKIKSTAAKRGIKIAAVVIGGGFMVYKMFLSNASTEPTQDQVDQGTAVKAVVVPKTSQDFANQDIPLGNKPNSEITSAPKQDDSKSIALPYNDIKNNEVALPVLKEVKLDAPDLPQLPDLTAGSDNLDLKPPSLSKLSHKTMKSDIKDDQQPATNPDGTPNQNAARPLNLQQVTQNGIPIINSADLSLEQKRQITMFVMNGSGPGSNSSTAGTKQKSDIIIVDGSALAVKKAAENITAEKVHNLDTTLIQGKTMDATLETAINSQIPGNVRGIINGDVYGEMGEKILIPRGTRIYGSYSSDVTRGQSRITVSWNRIIRPDGVSISISAQAADQFGRAGLEGDVDNRFADNFANSLLITFASLGTALALNQIAGSSATGTVSTVNGGTSVTSNPVNTAATAAIQSMQTMANNLTQGSNNLPPIVTLPQGTKIKVMVANDVTLPVFQKIKM